MASKQSRVSVLAVDELSEDITAAATAFRSNCASPSSAYDLFLQNLVKGTSHLSLGQEAVATGFCGCHGTRRSYFLYLSRAMPTRWRAAFRWIAFMELMGRDNGLAR